MTKNIKNTNLTNLLTQLKIAGQKSKAWKRVATDLSKPTRSLRKVNLYKLEKNTKDGLVTIVPGKVLGIGNLTKKLEVVAYQFSDSAVEKIKSAGGKTVSLTEYIKKNPDGKGIQILG